MGARHLGFGAETVYGTPVAPTKFFEVLSEGVQLEKNFETVPVMRAFSAPEIVELSSVVKGPMELLANFNGIGILYEHLLGHVTTSGAADPYTHTFPGTGGIPDVDRIGMSLTGEIRRDGALNWRYSGLKIVSLAQAFGVEQSSRITLGVIGKGETSGVTPASPTYPALQPMRPSFVSVLFDTVALKSRSASISIENPCDEPYLLGGTGLSDEPDRSGLLKVTGQTEVMFSNTTQYDKFVSGVSVNVEIAAVDAVSGHELHYKMAKCRLTQATPHAAGRERLTATYVWESYYNSDDTENIQVVLLNGDAT